MDTDPRFWLRILLLDDVNICTVNPTSEYIITDDDSGLLITIRHSNLEKTDRPINIQLSEGQIRFNDQVFDSKQIIISPYEPYVFGLNGSEYRGQLKLIVDPQSDSFDAINLVPLEAYLAGVVGAEMPDYWEPEALKAQAIAARTYCCYIKEQYGKNRHWDLRRTASHQVYSGLAAESAAVWNAVNQTRGMVLACKQPDGSDGIFPAYYSSICGGHTENSENVFGDSFKPLSGVPCPYCKDVARAELFFWPMVRLEKANVIANLLQRYPALEQLGEITDISALGQNYGDFSRMTEIQLHGSTGRSDYLKAEDFRLTIDPTGRRLKSAGFKIENWDDSWIFLAGRGFGHGVGMCQCGAEGLARKGKTAKEILSYYYPGSKITTNYLPKITDEQF